MEPPEQPNPLEAATVVDNSIAEGVPATPKSVEPTRKSSSELVASYDSLTREIRGAIVKAVDWDTSKEYLGFAPPGTARYIFDDNTLQKVYDTLSLQDDGLFPLDKATFVEVINKRRLHELLATMVMGHCSRMSAMSFANQLVANWPSNLPTPWRRRTESSPSNGDGGGGLENDATLLPHKRPELETILSTSDDAERFLRHQRFFCGIVLKKYTENETEESKEKKLPYLDEQPLREGRFSTVSKVRIARGHLQHPSNHSFEPETDPIILARKDIRFEDERAKADAQRERAIMETIFNNPSRKTENIVQYYGSISSDLSMSILMSCADSDLRAYMVTHPQPPKSRAARLRLLRSAAGLAQGLQFLHGMKTITYESIACYHLDIKPQNILVSARKDGDDLWQITDFGMSRIKYRHPNTDAEHERDTSRWFRKKYQESSFSTTKASRGEGTYQPPEADGSNMQTLKKESDIWSIGCVLSSLLAYMDQGYQGLERFADKRAAHQRSKNYDFFYVTSNTFGLFFRATLNSAVEDWHEQLGHDAISCHPLEGKLMRQLGCSLEKTALQINQKRRGDASSIVKLLETKITQYNELKDQVEGDKSWAEHSEGSASAGAVKEKAVTSRIITLDEPGVDFQGCAISEDASVIAYWTDRNIYIYGSLVDGNDSDVSKSKKKQASATSRPAVGGKSWRSVSLSSNRLVACAAKSNLCYIFELRQFESQRPQLSTFTAIPLEADEVQQVAISRNGLELACVVVGKDKKVYLFHTEIEGLKKLHTKRAHGTENSTVNIAERWLRLDWDVSSIAQLEISDRNSVFFVVKPNLSIKNEPCIVMVDLLDKKQRAIRIRHEDQHSSGSRGFFTCFTPFDQGYSGATVTNEKYIHIQVFKPDKDGKWVQPQVFNVPGFRIVNIMFEKQRQTLYALGTKGMDNPGISLLKVTVPTPDSPLPATIREIAKLDKLKHGDRFVAILVEFGSEDAASERAKHSHVLVASSSSSTGRRIYRISI